MIGNILTKLAKVYFKQNDTQKPHAYCTTLAYLTPFIHGYQTLTLVNMIK